MNTKYLNQKSTLFRKKKEEDLKIHWLSMTPKHLDIFYRIKLIMKNLKYQVPTRYLLEIFQTLN